jgi:MauM/NapG family ferredoxin protein
MRIDLFNLVQRLTSGRTALRPPGAVSEREFVRRCIKCNKCAQVCTYRSIRPARLGSGLAAGTPVINPRDVPCYLCMKCPPVCPTGALEREVVRKEDVWMGVAVIDEAACFAYAGIICRSCFDHCPIFREAITMRDEMYPVVHPGKCVGCGICENVCPMEEGSAITIRPRTADDPRRGRRQPAAPVAGEGG